MDIKQLYYFKTIVEEGTISKAAKILHMSQPPLSLQMQQLEKELDTKLLIRGPRKITLTDSGKFLYQRANSILNSIQSTKEELLEQRDGHFGKIKIGIVSSCHEYVLSHWICEFSKQYPNIHYELTESNTYDLIEQVSDHQIECAIVRTPFSIPNNLEAIHFETEPLYLVGIEKKKTIHLKEFKDQPFVIYRRWKKIIDEYFEKEHLPVNYLCVCDDSRTSIRWAENNLGYAIIPQSSLSYLKEGTPYTKIHSEDFSSQICLIKDKNFHISTTTHLFLDYIEKK